MGRFKKVLTGLGGIAVFGGGGMLFYQNMFIDRHAIVRFYYFKKLYPEYTLNCLVLISEKAMAKNKLTYFVKYVGLDSRSGLSFPRGLGLIFELRVTL